MESVATAPTPPLRRWARTLLAGGRLPPRARSALEAWGPYRVVVAVAADPEVLAGVGDRLGALDPAAGPVVRLERRRNRALWLVSAGFTPGALGLVAVQTGAYLAASPAHRSFRRLGLAVDQARTAGLGRLTGEPSGGVASAEDLTAADLEEVETCLQRLTAVLRSGGAEDLRACARGSLAVLGRQARGGAQLAALLGLLRARFVGPHQTLIEGNAGLRRQGRLFAEPEAAASLDDLADRLAAFLTGLTAHRGGPEGRSVIDQAIEFTRTSVDADLTMAVVANHFSMNYSRFSQRFKEAAGVGFNEYLRRVRIERSIELLKQSPLRVYEVAHRAGYQSTKYFMKVFKEQTGLSPTEFRQAVG